MSPMTNFDENSSKKNRWRHCVLLLPGDRGLVLFMIWITVLVVILIILFRYSAYIFHFQ